jgi:hypothetical protein
MRSFVFWGCSEIRTALGTQADSERQLLERLETVPAESIYHHSVRCLLRRRVAATPFPDDFSIWVASEVRDPVLAERLAFHSPFDFADIEAFREHLIETLDDHLSSLRFDPRARLGKPFYFLSGHLAAVPLELEATDLAGFQRALQQVDESSLYYHTVEAIGRLGNPRGDFAAWVEDELKQPDLARRMVEIDPFVMSLSGVRAQLLDLLYGERDAGWRA